MGRLINTSDLHNQVLLNKSDWGIFATTIDNLIEDIVSQVKTAEAIPEAEYETRLKEDVMIVLDFIFNKIKAEVESTRKMHLDTDDFDWLNGCDYVLSVIDKYKANKAESEEE